MSNFSEKVSLLYKKYKDDLKLARREMLSYKQNIFFNTQLEDVAGELTYLLIRENKPKTIVEISPCGGWSSLWISLAIEHGDLQCNYLSYDIIDDSEKNLPDKYKQKRKFFQGDCRKENFDFEIDYLFIDSEHSAQFAEWYIENLFPKMAKKHVISVHDIVDINGNFWYKISNEYYQLEGRPLVEYCEKNNKELWVTRHNLEDFKEARINNIERYEIHEDRDEISIVFMDEE